jgi:DNA end-binding protein Ku
VPRREARARRGKRAAEGGPEAEAPEAARPAGRAIWSGSLSFGLVTVPVELYSAQRRGGIALRMLTADGTPLARQYVCPEENRTLENEEIVRGYPVGEGEFVLVSDEELAALAPRRSRDIELLHFVPRDAIDPGYFVRAYFLVPGAEQTKAYALLAETMEKTGRAAIASFVMRDKAYAVAIFAEGGILRAETLRFADELRSPETLGLPESSEPDAARVRKLAKAIDGLAEDELAEDELRDDRAERLVELARRKRERDEDVIAAPEAPARAEAGEPGAPEAEGGDLVDLMALLKKRLRTQERARPKRAGARTKKKVSSPRRRSGRARSS